jgi:hypothetical protein
MLGRICAGLALVMVTASPVFASSSCGSPPVAPASVDGNTATEAQLKDAISDFKTFQKESDTYQSCLVADLKQQQAEAARANPPKTLDPQVEKGIDAAVNDNQRLKEKVGGELNGAILAYKAKHPG